MNIALVDVDGHNFPNFALMKIARYHKQLGDRVEWYNPLFSRPDVVYGSKVFTFTPDYDYYPSSADVRKGGTGYDITSKLPDEIDRLLPDYSIYPQYDFAIGFLSRGCIRKCPWCVVPRKEGKIRQYDDIERIAQGRKHVVLMDNNFLANDREFVKEQLEKSRRLGLRIDFNQALDARLVDDENARWLAAVKWIKYIRFACDTAAVCDAVESACKRVIGGGYNKEIFVYFLAKDAKETHERIMRMTSRVPQITPFVMPYRNLDGDGQIENDELKKLARWGNIQSIRKQIKWEDYK